MKFDAWIEKQYGRRERGYTEIDLRSAWEAGEEAAIQELRPLVQNLDEFHFLAGNPSLKALRALLDSADHKA